MAFLISLRCRSMQPVGRRWRTSRLHLEALEDRSLLSGYQQHNLVGFQPGMAHYTDPKLNGWGLAFAPDGPFWVADTSTGVSTLYDHQGKPLPLVVTIPAAPGGTVGSPTGIVYNPTSDFVISKNGRSAPALFLFDTIDGTISGWNPAVDPNQAVIMVDNSTATPRAHYFDLAIAQNSKKQNVLYAANGGAGTFDMFDDSFQPLGSFTDPQATASQSPVAYGVKEVNGGLYVTFVTFGPPPFFGGVVDVFDTDGNLLKHFAANAPGAGPLANPWGITQAPSNFGEFSNDILIGNVEGAGNINAFDPSTGAFLGQLKKSDGTPIAIAGLWDLDFGAGSPKNGKTNELFFTAGPNAISFPGNGLFGMIHAAGDQGQGDGLHADDGQHGGSVQANTQPLGISSQTAVTANGAAVIAGLESAPLDRMAFHVVPLRVFSVDSSTAAATARGVILSAPHALVVRASLPTLLDKVFADPDGSTCWDAVQADGRHALAE